MMGWTRAIHFKSWASTQEARHLLPLLVRRLVRTSIPRDATVTFPAFEQVGCPGQDGIVSVSLGNQYVPTGNSIWELGVTKDCKGKADEDFEKRTAEFSDVAERSQISFVFVTPREWQKKDEWAEKAGANSGWKHVAALDANDLEHWIEQCPTVDAWFSTITGRRPSGVLDLHCRWKALCSIAEHQLSCDVFVLGREKACDELLAFLKGDPDSVILASESIEDGLDFLSALASSRIADNREVERVVAVSDIEGWRSLSVQNEPMTLVVPSTVSLQAEDIAEAVQGGHHVIVVTGQGYGTAKRSITLTRQHSHHLIEALNLCGYQPWESRSKAIASSGSSSVLKRLLTKHPQTHFPAWSHDSNRSDLAPFVLIGGWKHIDSDAQESSHPWARTYLDLPCIVDLFGVSKEIIEERVVRWSECDEPLFLRFRDSVVLSSREDAWYLLGSAITPATLARFEDLAKLILEEDDPAYELAPNDRWLAAIYGKSHLLSDEFRKGILETLVLMSIYPTDRGLAMKQSFQSTVGRILAHALPSGAAWQRWATFAKHFSLFAEASPEFFISRIEADLASESPQLPSLFANVNEGIFSSSLHCGLLWSLEILAWSPEYLLRVAQLLARLTEYEHLVADNMSNRPSRSLHSIFSWWHPQTTATLEERLTILRSLAQKYPTVMWDFIYGLLPQGLQLFGYPTTFPRWRNWAAGWTRESVHANEPDSLREVALLAIELAGVCPRRWSSLIDRVFNCSPEITERAKVALAMVPASSHDAAGRALLWKELRNLIARHRAYSESDWVYAEITLDFMANVRDQLTPDDPVNSCIWLFDKHHPDLEGVPLAGNINAYDKELENQQTLALRSVVDACSWRGIERLLANSDSPHAIGWILGKGEMIPASELNLPEMVLSKEEAAPKFAASYIAAQFSHRGFKILADEWFQKCDANESGAILKHLPFERKTWDWIETNTNRETCNAYWGRCRGWVLNGNEADLEFVINRIMSVKRAFTAADILHASLRDTEASADLILQVLEAGLSSDTNNECLEQIDRYATQELIGILQKRGHSSSQRLATIEWGFLPLLDGHSTNVEPVTLLSELEKSPELYVELITLVFKAKSSPPGPVLMDEWPLHQAKNARTLLEKFSRVPGTQDNGEVDVNQLREWIVTVRALALNCDRLEIAEHSIGKMLASQPTIESQVWPSSAICHVLEEFDSESMFDGFRNAVMNGRGVTCRNPFEGGVKERELASKFRHYASVCRLHFHRVSNSLKMLADHYDDLARREDEDVERCKVGR